MNVLIVGGSGFLSGTCARIALDEGHRVAVITRGTKPTPSGVSGFVADRHDDAAFASAVDEATRSFDGSIDLVIDSIAFTAHDARQDVDTFAGSVGRLVLVSSDFVYDPARRRFPQNESDADYLTEGYGGGKRAAEEILLAAGTDRLAWSVLRPGHIYGPGSRLGCLPEAGRDPELIREVREGAAIPLVGAGHYLQQPIFVRDLAQVIVDLGNPGVASGSATGAIMNVAGPQIAESVTYYHHVARTLGVPLEVQEVPVEEYRREHPEHASFLCHRFYDTSLLAATGVRMPRTSLAHGIAQHVASLI